MVRGQMCMIFYHLLINFPSKRPNGHPCKEAAMPAYVQGMKQSWTGLKSIEIYNPWNVQTTSGVIGKEAQQITFFHENFFSWQQEYRHRFTLFWTNRMMWYKYNEKHYFSSQEVEFSSSLFSNGSPLTKKERTNYSMI